MLLSGRLPCFGSVHCLGLAYVWWGGSLYCTPFFAVFANDFAGLSVWTIALPRVVCKLFWTRLGHNVQNIAHSIWLLSCHTIQTHPFPLLYTDADAHPFPLLYILTQKMTNPQLGTTMLDCLSHGWHEPWARTLSYRTVGQYKQVRQYLIILGVALWSHRMCDPPEVGCRRVCVEGTI